MKYTKIDLFKEVFWTIIMYALYFIYCFAMVLLFHLIFYSLLKLHWTVATVAWMSFAASTIMIIVRTVKKVTGKR